MDIEHETILDARDGLVDHLLFPLLAATAGLGVGFCFAAWLASHAAAIVLMSALR